MFVFVPFIAFLYCLHQKITSTVPDGAVATTSMEVPRQGPQMISTDHGNGMVSRKFAVYRFGNAVKNCAW